MRFLRVAGRWACHGAERDAETGCRLGDDERGGHVLEELLADAGASVFGLLELGDPVVDAVVEF